MNTTAHTGVGCMLGFWVAMSFRVCRSQEYCVEALSCYTVPLRENDLARRYYVHYCAGSSCNDSVEGVWSIVVYLSSTCMPRSGKRFGSFLSAENSTSPRLFDTIIQANRTRRPSQVHDRTRRRLLLILLPMIGTYTTALR